jgi:hypothetical protein
MTLDDFRQSLTAANPPAQLTPALGGGILVGVPPLSVSFG